MAGAQVLGLVLAYLAEATDPAQYLQGNPAFAEDETVGDLLDEQLLKAATTGDVGRYRLVSDRAALWRKVTELGFEHGVSQFQRQATQARGERILMAEMGLLLLQNARSNEDRRDAMERFPATASDEGLAMARNMLDALSFQGASPDLFHHHVEIARLIERCLQIGIDRALAELR